MCESLKNILRSRLFPIQTFNISIDWSRVADSAASWSKLAKADVRRFPIITFISSSKRSSISMEITDFNKNRFLI